MTTRPIDPNTALALYLEKLGRAGFYGAINIKFEAGRAVHIHEERSWKPQDLPITEPSNESRLSHVPNR